MSEQKHILALPGVQLMFHVKHAGPALVAIAGGRQPQPQWLARLCSTAAPYCADRGAAHALAAGLVPAAVYGDGDSAGDQLFARLQAQHIPVQRFPVEKDATDLQLLLESLPQGNLVLTGALGGRFDHLYSNVFSLLAWQQQRRSMALLADEQELLLILPPGEEAEISWEQEPLAISLLPLTPSCRVSLQQVHWPLNNAELAMLHPYAISNVSEGENRLQCSCSQGYVGLYLCWQAPQC